MKMSTNQKNYKSKDTREFKKLSLTGATSSNENEKTQANKGANATGEAENPEDKFKKFEGEGVIYKAKLIGSELVMEPRGDKMCQNSIQRLKAIIRGQKSHKKRIVLKISFVGVKVYDEKTNEILHHHEVPQISFIAGDDTDSRTFGFVCDVPNKAHQFICFKTNGPAALVMGTMSSLFEAVLEKQKLKDKEQDGDGDGDGRSLLSGSNGKDNSNQITEQQPGAKQKHDSVVVKQQLTKDDSLTGDLDDLSDYVPASGTTNDDKSVAKTSSSAIDIVNSHFGDLILESPTVGSINETRFADVLSSSVNVATTTTTINNNSNIHNRNNFQGQPPPLSTSSTFDRSISFEQSSWADVSAHQQQFQAAQSPSLRNFQPRSSAVAASFDDSKANISLVNQSSSAHESSTSPFDLIAGDSGIVDSPSNASDMAAGSPASKNAFLPKTLNLPSYFDSNASNAQAHQFTNDHNQQSVAASVAASNSDASNIGINNRHQNRSLVYNHSSVSLNDAALTRQSSFSGTNLPVRESGTDKYAVFNDIDNLPSIFESTSSLGSTSKLSNVGANGDNGQQVNMLTGGNPNYNQQPTSTGNTNYPLAGGGFFPNTSSASSAALSAANFPTSSSIGTGIAQQAAFGGRWRARPNATPSMMVPTNSNYHNNNNNNNTSDSLSSPQTAPVNMIVGSAPIRGLNQHGRFSSATVASLHQRLNTSSTSVGSAGGLSRQTNPFDDDFFA